MGTGKDISVAVLSDGRVSNQQWFSYSAPAIQSVTPQSGPPIGSNLVTIEVAVRLYFLSYYLGRERILV
jgi:hypothetical protein